MNCYLENDIYEIRCTMQHFRQYKSNSDILQEKMNAISDWYNSSNGAKPLESDIEFLTTSGPNITNN